MKRLGLLFCFCFLSHLFSLLVPISVLISDLDFGSGFLFRISDLDIGSGFRFRISDPDFFFWFRFRIRISVPDFGSGFFLLVPISDPDFSSGFRFRILVPDFGSDFGSDSLISLNYSMPTFSANSFGLFRLHFLVTLLYKL